MIQDRDQKFINRLNQHPKLRERLEVLLNVVENTAGDCTKADDAEHYVIEELRKMGNDALHCWAENAVEKTSEAVRKQQPKPQGHGKKNLLAHNLRRNNRHRAFISQLWATD